MINAGKAEGGDKWCVTEQRAGQGKAGQGRAGHGSVEQGRAVQGKTR